MSKKLTKLGKLKSCKRGFTLIELLVSIAIFGILAGFSSWAYLNVQKNSDLSNQTSQLVNTIRQVQSYAMTGQTGLSFERGTTQTVTRNDAEVNLHNFLYLHDLCTDFFHLRGVYSATSEVVHKSCLFSSTAYAAGAGAPPPTNEQLNMGIHFETDQYILFYGSIYGPEDARNITTNLPVNIIITTDLPTSDLIFTALTGEVQAYDANHHIITISHSDGQTHILTVNKWGVMNVD